MRMLLCLAAWSLLIPPLQDFGQDSNNDGWGPWRHTWDSDKPWSGIPFHSKCIANAGGDSKWAYQFKSKYGGTMHFVARIEHDVAGAATNGFNRNEIFSIDGHALSPVFETVLHGTCEQLGEQKHELAIEVLCVTNPFQDTEVNDPCYHDEYGEPRNHQWTTNEKRD
jgi:hypothetical protein